MVAKVADDAGMTNMIIILGSYKNTATVIDLYETINEIGSENSVSSCDRIIISYELLEMMTCFRHLRGQRDVLARTIPKTTVDSFRGQRLTSIGTLINSKPTLLN